MGVEVHQRTEEIAQGWDDLANRVRAVPWVRRGWIEAWLEAFARGRPETFVLRDHDRIVALLPFVRRGEALFSPANWHTPAFAPLAENEAAAGELADAVLRLGARRVDLRFLPRESPVVKTLRTRAEGAGYRVLTRILMRSPYVAVEGSWEDYEHRLGRNLRGDVRRRRRRLEEQGNLTIDVENGGEGLEELLDEGFRIEASGWKGRNGTAIISNSANERFYRSVARWARDEQWLRLVFLRVGGRPLAFHFDLEADGVLYHLKGGYDAAFEQYSPGKVLHYAMLSRAFALGLERYEFLGAEEPYKLAWTSTTHERWLFQAFARSLPGVTEWAAFQYGRPLAKRLLSVAR